MPVSRNRIEKNLARIRENIRAACDRSHRSAEDVSIVAVTKTVELDTIRNLLDAGLTEFGESRAQQLTDRAAELDAYLQRRRNELPAPVRWHMIGHLQRNKVKSVLKASTIVHSVDSLRLAEELQDRASRTGLTVEVFVQVNCSQESQKYGVPVGAAPHLGEMICTFPSLRLVGLMTMAPLTKDRDAIRQSFARLREIYNDMQRDGIAAKTFRHLSMGMSKDYEIAVEEGATLLRIGSALFE
ncbi:MAG: YggS family pyridoxal phosphate-dependent enzyme [Phycisphaerae bacterium]